MVKNKQAIGKGERLIMACEDGSIISWSVSDKDMGKAKTLKKGSGFSRIAVDPALDAAVLVGSDGKIRAYSPDLKTELCSAHVQLPGDSAEAICAKLLGDEGSSDGSLLLIVAYALPEGGLFVFRSRIRGSKDAWSFSKSKGDKLRSEGLPLVCEVSKGHRLLSVVWEGGNWDRYRIPALGEDQSVVLRGSGLLGGVTRPSSSGPSSGVHVASAGQDYLLSAGLAQSGGGASVFVHDLLYGSLQGEAGLRPDDADETFAMSAPTSMAVTRDNFYVAAAVGGGVVSCGLDNARVTLASVLAGGVGTAAPPQAWRPVDILACLEGVDADEEGGGLVSGVADIMRKAVEAGNRREEGVLQRLEKTKAAKAFVDEVENFLHELEREGAEEADKAALRNGNPPAAERGGVTKRGQPNRSVPSQYFVHEVLKRCTSEGAKGAYDRAIMLLLECGAVSGRAEPGLFAYAHERCDLSILRGILTYVCDLPEEALVHALELVLDKATKSSLDAFVTACAAEEPNRPVLDHDQVRRDMIDLIMVQPREHTLLVIALRRLSLKQTVRLLKYSQSLLRMHGVHALASKLRSKGARSPSLTCVIEWTSAILDAHYSSLALAPDCRELLEELRGIVKGEGALMREMLSLDGPLSHIIHKKRLPVKPVKDYQVDTLYL